MSTAPSGSPSPTPGTTPSATPSATPERPGWIRRHRRKLDRRKLLVALGLLLVVDLLLLPPRYQASAAVLLGAIDLYQATASRWLPHLGVSCRFTPTCSHYAEAVIRRDGALVGSVRSLGRILRCGPWTPAGTSDPP